MLLQEVISLTDDERNFIRKYVHILETQIKKYQLQGGTYRLKLIMALVEQRMNNIDLFRGTQKQPLPIELFFDWKSKDYGVFVPNKGNYKIRVNLAKMIKCKQMNDIWWITDIDFERIYSIIVHEFVHFRQRHSKAAHFSDPFNSKKDYFSRGFEQGAWAAGNVEKIRKELEPFATNGQAVLPYVIKALQHRGMSDQNLNHLKEKNPLAWKQIMKKAVLIAMNDMKNDKLPWQSNRNFPE